MKRIILIITGLISLIFLSCSSNLDKRDFFGTYTFEEVAFLSPLSSYSIDHLNEGMKGTKYIISADLFKIESSKDTTIINSPGYVKEEIPKESFSLSDVRTFIGDKVKYQYNIYDKNRNKTNWRLYEASDGLWVASYVDNTANGTEIIMSIYKLSK